MIKLQMAFRDDGSLSIFNPENGGFLRIDQDQKFQLYDSILMDYYKEEVRAFTADKEKPMRQLSITFSPDGSLSIFNPETHESMKIDKDQKFQLYDSIQLDYYKEEVRDNITGRMENHDLAADVAGALLVDSEFISQVAAVYQQDLRESQTICGAEHELLVDTVNEAIERINGRLV